METEKGVLDGGGTGAGSPETSLLPRPPGSSAGEVGPV